LLFFFFLFKILKYRKIIPIIISLIQIKTILYKGIQLSTGRKVAIKKIKLGDFKDGFDMTAIREIKFLQELKHPNIIEVISNLYRKIIFY